MMKKEQRIAQMLSQIEAMQPELTALRRDFHRHPETGWLEMRTSAILARRLDEMGYEVLTGRAVCREEARLGVPGEDTLAAHAEQALLQGAPAEYLTQDMREGFTGVVAILRCGEGPDAGAAF